MKKFQNYTSILKIYDEKYAMHIKTQFHILIFCSISVSYIIKLTKKYLQREILLHAMKNSTFIKYKVMLIKVTEILVCTLLI